ncbi:PQQ-binding-like beta-propeller repeat protein [Actinosynnema sp. NPDC047251]|uniref:Pyrrolo-quinoline quinone repeat domain-containing protein n=1 Tax=Saccharothrix espanaensis (strain ATCC 51144 / DSM 44229 / JCM 9112 / NBRC 15066 / NRRL 15764) TaxID=1179773 RepID=K0KBY3_SACES|nr:PQQ-binding-like beta-propeller repeat protein [Saccharothrix espanaensis]CCH35711.1 hypothetical protein BN6_84970 [Saccharothrix espanaensis DSM 44229]
MLRFLVVVGAGCAVVALFLPLPYGRPEAIDYPLIVPVGVVVAAAVGALRGWKVLSVVAAVMVLVAVSAAVVMDVKSGLPGVDLPVLALGALAVAVGGVAAGPGVPWCGQVVGVVAGVVVAGAAVVAPGVADAAAVRSVVGAAQSPADPVQRPGGRRWDWRPSSPVTELVAAGRGVAVAMANGVIVGLDGTSGAEVWRYERRGNTIGGLVGSADGRTVLATFQRDHRAPKRLLVVLDAVTGAVRSERVVGTLSTDNLKAGTTVYLVDGSSTITAHDLVTGEPRWRWTGVDGCGGPEADVAGVGRDRVSLTLNCGDRLAVVGLDEATGEERWRTEVPLVAERGSVRRRVEAEATTDGSVVAVRMVGEKLPADAITNGLVDAATGRVVRLAGPATSVVVTAGPVPLIRDRDSARVTNVWSVDPATGATTALDAGICETHRAEATTAATYLRICYGRDTGLTVVTQDLTGGPPSVIPLERFGPAGGIDSRIVVGPGAVVMTGSSSWTDPSPVVGFAN